VLRLCASPSVGDGAGDPGMVTKLLSRKIVDTRPSGRTSPSGSGRTFGVMAQKSATKWEERHKRAGQIRIRTLPNRTWKISKVVFPLMGVRLQALAPNDVLGCSASLERGYPSCGPRSPRIMPTALPCRDRPRSRLSRLPSAVGPRRGKRNLLLFGRP